MKALTLRQPWASLVALGHKRIETRGWQTPHRGPLAIHAGVSLAGWGRKGTRTPLGAFEVQRTPDAMLLRGPIAWPYAVPLGAVVATCELVDVIPIHEESCEVDVEPPYVRWVHDALMVVDRTVWYRWEPDERPYGDFRCGRFAWLLDDIQPVNPTVPAKGRQGLWNWDGAS